MTCSPAQGGTVTQTQPQSQSLFCPVQLEFKLVTPLTEDFSGYPSTTSVSLQRVEYHPKENVYDCVYYEKISSYQDAPTDITSRLKPGLPDSQMFVAPGGEGAWTASSNGLRTCDPKGNSKNCPLVYANVGQKS